MKKTSIIYLLALLLIIGIFGYILFFPKDDKTIDKNINQINTSESKNSNTNINNVKIDKEVYQSEKVGFSITLPDEIKFWKEERGIRSSGQAEDYATFLIKQSTGENYFIKDPFWLTVRRLDSQDKTIKQWAEVGIDGTRELEGYGVLSKVIQNEPTLIDGVNCLKQIEESGEAATTPAYQKIIYCLKNDKIYLIEGYAKTAEDFMPYQNVFDEFVDKFNFD